MQSSAKVVQTPSDVESSLGALAMPKTNHNETHYAAAILGLGLALFNTGCSSTPPAAISPQDLAISDKVGEVYSEAASSGTAAAQLSLAEMEGSLPITKVNEMFQKASSLDSRAAQLVLLAALGGNDIATLNERFESGRGDSNSATNLATAATLADKDIGAINALYKQTSPWDTDAASILTIAAVAGHKSIADVNAMYKANPVSGVSGAVLVLGSVLSGASMQKMQELYSRAATTSTTDAAHLAALAAIHRTSIDKVNDLWKLSSGSSETAVLLVQAALLSGKSMTEINYLYHHAPTWGEHAAAILVTKQAILEQEQKDNSLDMIPFLYTRSAGKQSYLYPMYLLVPAECGFEGTAFRVSHGESAQGGSQ